MDWRSQMKADPLPHLLRSDDEALLFQIRRDLQGKRSIKASELWDCKEINGLEKKQREDGTWKYPGKCSGLALGEDYDFFQTWKVLSMLVECYCMDRSHPMVEKAVEALLAKQTDEGDIRGIYGNQYSPNYTAAAIELAIKAGYAKDKRVEKAFSWVVRVRQYDGGWAVPLRAYPFISFREAMVSDPLPPVGSKPSSYWCTGVVLRAFAADKKRARSREAHEAGEVLKKGFFRAEPYPDRRTVDFWTKFTFPFQYNDLCSSLDVLSRLGFPGDDPDIVRAVDYFRGIQNEDGSFDLRLNLARGKDVGRWVTFSFCRSLARLYGGTKA